MATVFEEKVFAACAKIRKGRVSTYSEIAKAIGKPKAMRAVGNALNKNRSPLVPCHRVVRSEGRVGGFAHGSRKKQEMLEREGVRISSGKVKNFKMVFCKLSAF